MKLGRRAWILAGDIQELLEAIPPGRRRAIADRVEKTMAAMPLDELRKAREMTQAKLAETLGVNQGDVSKIERRADRYVSALASYIEALGGTLQIRAVFRDQEVRIIQFEGLPR